ncbi:MaoC/PaaZ C-terminal domain-containing protein [Pseudomonas sp. NPDC007930]|uniref:MaoC/PaaZ C-terminal domain-containing protein n=1 Tax=Pseudomonas sp. NPDC007930 TaxID=3364417 RepID=UPI0036E1ADDB
MALARERLLGWRFPEVRQAYTAEDCMRYALAVGAGAWEGEPAPLAFTHEAGLKVLPTQVVTLGYPGFWLMAPATGLDWRQVLHVEQAITWHRPLPLAATVYSRSRVAAVYDQGPGRGALLVTERTLHLAGSGECLASLRWVEYCRGEGGCGGPPAPPAYRPQAPARPADASLRWPISPQAALLYRLCGDRNPLHVDPAVARQAGFERPILHGLCTLGAVAYALVNLGLGGQPEGLRALRARFIAPVYPGDTLTVSVWRAERQVLADVAGRAVLQGEWEGPSPGTAGLPPGLCCP